MNEINLLRWQDTQKAKPKRRLILFILALLCVFAFIAHHCFSTTQISHSQKPVLTPPTHHPMIPDPHAFINLLSTLPILLPKHSHLTKLTRDKMHLVLDGITAHSITPFLDALSHLKGYRHITLHQLQLTKSGYQFQIALDILPTWNPHKPEKAMLPLLERLNQQHRIQLQKFDHLTRHSILFSALASYARLIQLLQTITYPPYNGQLLAITLQLSNQTHQMALRSRVMI